MGCDYREQECLCVFLTVTDKESGGKSPLVWAVTLCEFKSLSETPISDLTRSCFIPMSGLQIFTHNSTGSEASLFNLALDLCLSDHCRFRGSRSMKHLQCDKHTFVKCFSVWHLKFIHTGTEHKRLNKTQPSSLCLCNFSSAERKAGRRRAVPSSGPRPRFKRQIMFYFYLLKATFPVCAPCRVSPSTKLDMVLPWRNKRMDGTPELTHTGKRKSSKKGKLTHLRLMLGVGLRRKWFSAGEYNGRWWHCA